MIDPSPGSDLIVEARRALRRCVRTDITLAAEIEVILADGTLWTRGTAMVRNISLKGALLGRLVLNRQALPAARFTIRIRFRAPEYRGVGAVCRPVRFGLGPRFELAVEFEDFWARADDSKTTRRFRKEPRGAKRKKKRKGRGKRRGK